MTATLTEQDLQLLRSMGHKSKAAADEVVRLRAELNAMRAPPTNLTVDSVMESLIEPVLDAIDTSSWVVESWAIIKEGEIRAAVELLAQQARDAALDEAAQACRRERVAADETGMPEDRAYNYATEHCESAIHALKTAL